MAIAAKGRDFFGFFYQFFNTVQNEEVRSGSNDRYYQFLATLSSSFVPATISLNYSTSGGNATAGREYQSLQGMSSIANVAIALHFAKIIAI